MVGTKRKTVQWPSINSTVCRGINTDRCLNKGLGGNMQWNLNRGDVVCSGYEKPHECLRTWAIKLAIQTFLKTMKHKVIHLQLDNMVASTYLLNKVGTHNLKLIPSAKEICDYFQCGITLNADYPPSKLNVIADWESRNNSDSSDGNLAPSHFRKFVNWSGPQR